MRCIKIIKEGRRRRYIGFTIKKDTNTPILKKDMISEIREKSEKVCKKDFREMDLFLVIFNGTQGIVRCKHTEKNNTIKILKRIDEIKDEKVLIDTIATSGTIKSLIKKHMSDFDI